MLSILLLTPQLPYPPHQGTSLRNFHIIKGLSARHHVSLLSFVEDNQRQDDDTLRPLLAHCDLVRTVPVPVRTQAMRLRQLVSSTKPDLAHRLRSERFADVLRELLCEKTFDIVQIEGLELAHYAAVIRQVSPTTRIAFDNHNAETELQRRALLTDLAQPRRWLAAAYSLLQVFKLRRFERWACLAADIVFAVSDTDAQSLKALTSSGADSGARHAAMASRSPEITAVPNCIDVEQYQRPAAQQFTYDIVFSGKMDYRPNIDAALWFADQILPLIQRQRPNTTFAVVGQKPHRRVEPLASRPGITLTGWVESVVPYLAGAAVFAMPFRVGSGTRLKLIEAMAMGKAVVSTTIGAEGYPVTGGQHLLIADTPEAFASAILDLLRDPERARRLGEEARAFAHHYDWRNVVPLFDQAYQRLLRDPQ